MYHICLPSLNIPKRNSLEDERGCLWRRTFCCRRPTCRCPVHASCCSPRHQSTLGEGVGRHHKGWTKVVDRAHMLPISDVKVPCPCILPLSNVPSYLRTLRKRGHIDPNSAWGALRAVGQSQVSLPVPLAVATTRPDIPRGCSPYPLSSPRRGVGPSPSPRCTLRRYCMGRVHRGRSRRAGL